MDPILRGTRTHTAVAIAVLLLTGVATGGAPERAHAFLDHAEPRVGHTLDTEPVFSTIRVEGADRKRVDKGDVQVDPHDSTLLEVGLPPLPSGEYHVFWSVVARDGHRTEGSFPFQIK